MSATEPENESEPTFEEAIGRLERIVSTLERGDLDLATSLASYERGVALLARCQSLLDGVDRSVALLTGVEPDGTPIVAPFDASATSGDKPAPGNADSEATPAPPSRADRPRRRP